MEVIRRACSTLASLGRSQRDRRSGLYLSNLFTSTEQGQLSSVSSWQC